MSDLPPSLCPHCHQPILLAPVCGRRGHSQLVSSFASGGVAGHVHQPYKMHRKPLVALGYNHFLLAGLVAIFVGVVFFLGVGGICYFASECYDLVPVLMVTIVLVLFVAVVTLRFIDGGRYEVREELSPAAAVPSFKLDQVPRPEVRVVEFRELRAHGGTWKWFPLPSGVTDEVLRSIALVLRSNAWKYSRPALCDTHKVISQHRYHKLTALLKEKGFLRRGEGNSSVLTPAGRAFFRDYLKDTPS